MIDNNIVYGTRQRMYPGYVYGITDKVSGKASICIFSKVSPRQDGNMLYEINNQKVEPFQFNKKTMNIEFQMPLGYFIEYCVIQLKHPFEQIIEIENQKDIEGAFIRCLTDIKKQQEVMTEWDETGKTVHNQMIERIGELNQKREIFLEKYPFLADVKIEDISEDNNNE